MYLGRRAVSSLSRQTTEPLSSRPYSNQQISMETTKMNFEESQILDDFDRDAIVASFLVESSEGLTMMEQALVLIEDDSSDEALLNDIFRVAHTIKGNASSLGFP